MPRAFFFEAVAVHPGQRLDQRGLAVVDMACGADDHCWNLSASPNWATKRASSCASRQRRSSAGVVALIADDGRGQGAKRRFQGQQPPCPVFAGGGRPAPAEGRRSMGTGTGRSGCCTADRLTIGGPGPPARPGRAFGRGAMSATGGSAGAAWAGVRTGDRGRGRGAAWLPARPGWSCHAQGALERVLLDLGNQVLAPDDEPGLRAAQQLVAEKVTMSAPAARACCGVGSAAAPGRQSRSACRCPGRDEGQARSVGDVGNGSALHHLGKAHDGVVAGVHLHQQARSWGRWPPVVLRACGWWCRFRPA